MRLLADPPLEADKNHQDTSFHRSISRSLDLAVALRADIFRPMIVDVYFMDQMVELHRRQSTLHTPTIRTCCRLMATHRMAVDPMESRPHLATLPHRHSAHTVPRSLDPEVGYQTSWVFSQIMVTIQVPMSQPT